MPDIDPDKSNLLALRARRLAERTGDAGVVEAREPILIFRLGAERFALRLKFVASVVPFGLITPVPTSGDDVLGVMSIRGEVHTVYALDRLLELPRSEALAPSEGHVLALRGVGRQVGVRVDRVEAIDEIAAATVAAATSARAFVAPVASAPLILIEGLEALFNSLSRGEDQ